MEILLPFLIFILTLIFIKLLPKNYFFLNKDENLPPCLPHIPILGSMPFLPKIDVLHQFLTEKSKKLGNVIGMHLANRYAVVLCGREAIQEALVKNSVEFAQRPLFYLNKYINTQNLGLVSHQYNEHFKRFHYLSLSILRKFGFGQGIMEQRIKREVEEMINRFDKNDEKDFDPADIMTLCISNVIVTIIFGKRMKLEDPKFTELVEIVHEILRDVDDPTTLNFFPFLRFFPKYKKAIQIEQQREKKMRLCMEEKIQESLDGKTQESFISCFIEAIGADVEREQLLYTLRDLFLAGTETTSSTLLWLIVLLANHQEIQKKAQKEIDTFVNRENLPTMEDKSKLKYLEATIMESMRYKTIVPLALVHVTSAETLVQGKKIPAGTWVFPNLYSVHMDENIWKDPHKFNPERFIDTNGELINKNLIIPFSLGKRSCFGESLARQEIFLFASALIHQYNILPPDGQNKISMDENVGITISPKNFKVKIIKRQ